MKTARKRRNNQPDLLFLCLNAKSSVMKRIALLLLPALAAACGPGSHLSESPETTDASDGPATPSVETVTPLSRVELTDAEKARVESGNVFAFKLLQKVYAEQQASIIMSPLSVQYALGMVNNGASGETERQISAVLGQEGRADLNAFCRHLLSDLPRVDTTVTLSIANGILLNNDYTMKPAFQQAVEENYDALVEAMPFANPNAVVSRVNGWCSEKTCGKIPQILSDVSPDAILFALNAIYFKGSWRDAFNAKYTREQDFRTAGGGTTPVQMMHREGKFSYGENDHFQRLALPYGNGRFAMEVFLPKGDLAECLEYMKNTPWSELKKGSSPEVIVSFPRFKTETFLNLNKILSALGMPRAFTDGAQFFDLVENDAAKISRVLHKALIEVEETGTEAAAVTAVEMVRLTAIPDPPKPKYFTADHPFVYVITERSSGAILFTGVFTGE